MKMITNEQINVEILEIIASTIKRYPQLRFMQTLEALGIVSVHTVGEDVYYKDQFYEESVETLKRLKEQLKTLKG